MTCEYSEECRAVLKQLDAAFPAAPGPITLAMDDFLDVGRHFAGVRVVDDVPTLDARVASRAAETMLRVATAMARRRPPDPVPDDQEHQELTVLVSHLGLLPEPLRWTIFPLCAAAHVRDVAQDGPAVGQGVLFFYAWQYLGGGRLTSAQEHALMACWAFLAVQANYADESDLESAILWALWMTDPNGITPQVGRQVMRAYESIPLGEDETPNVPLARVATLSASELDAWLDLLIEYTILRGSDVCRERCKPEHVIERVRWILQQAAAPL